MTRLRKLAITVSDSRDSRSPSAFKDWARATRREIRVYRERSGGVGLGVRSWKMAARCHMLRSPPCPKSSALRELFAGNSCVSGPYLIQPFGDELLVFRGLPVHGRWTANPARMGSWFLAFWFTSRARRLPLGMETPPRRWVAGGCQCLPVGPAASARPPLWSLALVSNHTHRGRADVEHLPVFWLLKPSAVHEVILGVILLPAELWP